MSGLAKVCGLNAVIMTTIATMLPVKTNCQRQIDTVRTIETLTFPLEPQVCRKITEISVEPALQADPRP